MSQQLSKTEYFDWLSEQPWRTIQAEAEKIGFEKPDDQKWADVVDEITELKYASEDDTVIEEAVEEPEVVAEAIADTSDTESKSYQYVWEGGIRKCLACGIQIRTGFDNTVFCPVSDPSCPRPGA